MHYSNTVYIALFGWPVLMLLLAFVLPVRRVVLISVIGGNLFLPMAGLALPGFPNYTKSVAVGLGALLAAGCFALPQLLQWRPKPIDLFFIAFLFSPTISSILNGLGPWDAVSTLVNRFLVWGVAYWIGRALFNDEEAIRELAVAIVIGGLVYAPLCIWESIMSPQLHKQLYGFRPSSFIMTRRMGGWRPMVFMQHGLAVGVWMASSAIVAWMLWKSKAIRGIGRISMSVIAAFLVLVTISLRSTGAAILLLGLIFAMEFVRLTRMKVAMMAVLLLPAGYIALRVAGWDGEQLVEMTSILGEERAASLDMRLENDAMIVDQAMENPVFGWGGWGRWRVHDAFGRDITVSDSWWGIIVGQNGIFGLVAAYGTFIAPMFLLIRRRLGRQIFTPVNGAAWAVGISLLLFVLDTLANAMPNGSFMLAAGAMTAYVVRLGREPRPVAVGERPGSPSQAEINSHPPRRPRTVDLR